MYFLELEAGDLLARRYWTQTRQHFVTTGLPRSTMPCPIKHAYALSDMMKTCAVSVLD